MGGSDNPSNLIELTVEEHAEAHKLLYEKYGKKEDEVAWKGLLKIINKQECIHEMQKEGGKRSSEKMYGLGQHNFQIKNASSYEHVRKLRSERMMGNKIGLQRKITEELRYKLSEASKGNTNVKGKKWWNRNGERRRSEKCPGEGWKEGFKIN